MPANIHWFFFFVCLLLIGDIVSTSKVNGRLEVLDRRVAFVSDKIDTSDEETWSALDKTIDFVEAHCKK